MPEQPSSPWRQLTLAVMRNGINIRVVVLDLNGTLIERSSESPHLRSLVCEYIKDQCPGASPTSQYFQESGLPTKEFLNEYGLTHALYQEWCSERCDPSRFQMHAGTPGALIQLAQQYQLVLLSNSTRAFVERVVDSFGWSDILAYVGTAEDGYKPDTPAFSNALEAVGVPAEQAVGVGDRVAKDIMPLCTLGGYGLQIRWQFFFDTPRRLLAHDFTHWPRQQE